MIMAPFLHRSWDWENHLLPLQVTWVAHDASHDGGLGGKTGTSKKSWKPNDSLAVRNTTKLI